MASRAKARFLEQDAQLIQIVDAALADATRRAGRHLACRPGCTQCCYGAFAITPLDALRLRIAMVDLARIDPAQAAAIEERAQRYLAEFGSSFPGDRVSGILGSSPEDEAAFEDFANDAPCPALNPANGLCDLYAASPMTCRVFGPPVQSGATGAEGLAVCELCFTEANPEEIAAAEMSVPHAQEQTLIEELEQSGETPLGDTIVAYCLAPNGRPNQEPTAA